MKLLFLIITTLLISTISYGQSLQERVHEALVADTLYQQGRYQEVLDLLEKQYDTTAHRNWGSKLHLFILLRMSESYQALRNSTNAKKINKRFSLITKYAKVPIDTLFTTYIHHIKNWQYTQNLEIADYFLEYAKAKIDYKKKPESYLSFLSIYIRTYKRCRIYNEVQKMANYGLKLLQEIKLENHAYWHLSFLDYIIKSCIFHKEYILAEKYINEYLKFLKKNIDSENEEYYRHMYVIGQNFKDLRDYQNAEKYLVKSFNIQHRLNISQSLKAYEISFGNQVRITHTYESVLYELISLYTHDIFDYDKATFYQHFLREYLENNNTDGSSHQPLMLLFENMGKLYQKTQQYDSAEVFLQLALEIAENDSNIPKLFYASLLSHTIGFYQAVGIENKENHFKKQLWQLKSHIKIHSLDKELLFTILFKNNKEKISYYEECLRNIVDTQSFEYSAMLGILGEYYLRDQQYRKSIDYNKRSMMLIPRMTLDEKIGNYSGIADAYIGLNMYDSAEIYRMQTIDMIKEVYGANHSKLTLECFKLIKNFISQEKYLELNDIYSENLQSFFQYTYKRFAFMNEKQKSDFFESIQAIYEKSFILNMKIFQKSKSMTSLEERKKYQSIYSKMSQNFYNLALHSKHLLLNNAISVQNYSFEEDNSEFSKLFFQWQELRAIKANQIVIPNFKRTVNIDTINYQIQLLETKLSKISYNFANYLSSLEIDWKTVQSYLEPKEAALEVLRLQDDDEIYYVFLIIRFNTQYPEIVFIEDGKELEREGYENYQNNLNQEDHISFNLYWKKLENALQGVEKIYFSNDGIYNSINIKTLFDANTQSYVFEKYDIEIITSTKNIVQEKHVIKTKLQTALLLGRPQYNGKYKDLIASKKEVEEIANVLEANFIKPNVKTDYKATEMVVKKIVSPSILHIASHGVFYEERKKSQTSVEESRFKFQKSNEESYRLAYIENPMFRSALILSGTTEKSYLRSDDGYLTAYEVVGLKLQNTELVVLSACSSGRGSLSTKWQGVYGLQSAFKQAGAKTIIMSLWPVDDQVTQKFMIYFYKNWMKLQDKHTAFKEAQITIMDLYEEPKYWGAFVMIE